jgi:hypothetical protein
MTPAWAGSLEELRQLLRARADELNVSRLTIDEVAGTQSGYCGKLLAEPPTKGFGEMSLGAVLGALALKIARIEFVEDPEQAARVIDRWEPRKRSPNRKS